ncbi:hypothetical protein [Streptomyces sp. NRRL F-5630]|uniref:hypothetical protein n=1 Tax=Streptomyces sp. NRRL F-5630 TaxID=1463864 RepID=UPI003D725E66
MQATQRPPAPTTLTPRDLDQLFARYGGAISGGPAGTAFVLALTTRTPDGVITVTAEWEPAAHPENADLPIMQALAAGTTVVREPRPAIEPLGDLFSGDALHTNPATHSVRAFLPVDVVAQIVASADARVLAVTA